MVKIKEMCDMYELDYDKIAGFISSRAINPENVDTEASYADVHSFVIVKYAMFHNDGATAYNMSMPMSEFAVNFLYDPTMQVLDVILCNGTYGHRFDAELLRSQATHMHLYEHNYMPYDADPCNDSIKTVLNEMKEKHLKRHDGHKQLRQEKTNSKMKLIKGNMLCNDLNNEIFKFLGWTK